MHPDASEPWINRMGDVAGDWVPLGASICTWAQGKHSEAPPSIVLVTLMLATLTCTIAMAMQLLLMMMMDSEVYDVC